MELLKPAVTVCLLKIRKEVRFKQLKQTKNNSKANGSMAQKKWIKIQTTYEPLKPAIITCWLERKQTMNRVMILKENVFNKLIVRLPCNKKEQ